MSGDRVEREANWLAILSLFAVLPWLLFHLWEQWAAFEGRGAWLARMHGTSGSTGMRVAEVVGAVLPLVALSILSVRAFIAGGPLPGHATDADDGLLVRVLSRVSKPALGASVLFFGVHLAWLWLPRAFGVASLAQGYEALRVAAGTPVLLAVHAIGLCAVCVHLAAAVPAWLGTVGLITTRAARRSAALVGTGLATCLLVLLVQLYGWHATGTGTVWPVRVVDAVVETPGELDAVVEAPGE